MTCGCWLHSKKAPVTHFPKCCKGSMYFLRRYNWTLQSYNYSVSVLTVPQGYAAFLGLKASGVGSGVAPSEGQGRQSSRDSGQPRWITNGIFSDYFTCAVRTGAAGMRGVSMLLVERSEGLSTKRMDCQGGRRRTREAKQRSDGATV